MTSAGDVFNSVSIVMVFQTWPPLPLCGDIKVARPEDTDHAVITRLGVSVQEAPWGHWERWFLKMFPHLCADCGSQTRTHTWINKAVGVSRQRLSGDTTVDEAMKQWKPVSAVFLFLRGGSTGVQRTPAEGCLLFQWVRQAHYQCSQIIPNIIYHVTRSTPSSNCCFQSPTSQNRAVGLGNTSSPSWLWCFPSAHGPVFLLPPNHFQINTHNFNMIQLFPCT